MSGQKFIRRTDVPAFYGVSARQLKRWCAEKRIRSYHPAGERGPAFLKIAELDALFEPSAKGRKSA